MESPKIPDIRWKKGTKGKLAKLFFVLIVISFTILSFTIFPQKTQAQYTDVPASAQRVVAQITANLHLGQAYLTAFNTYYLQYKEMILDPLAWVTSKIELAKQVQSLIKLANGNGGLSNPKFVVDLALTMSQVATGAANDFFNGGTIDWANILCNPTRTPGYDLTGIPRALSNQNRKNARDRNNANFKNKIQCVDLANSISDIGAFVAGDFNQGGIDGLFALSQSGGTVYDVYTESEQELDRQIAEAQYYEEQQLLYGNGFISTEIKTDTSNTPITNLARPGDSNGGVKTPGTLIEGEVKSALAVGKQTLVAIDEFSELITNALAAIGADSLGGGGKGNSGFIDYNLTLGGPTVQNDGSLAPETPPEIPPQVPPDTTGNQPPPPGSGINLALGKPCWQSGQYLTLECKFAVDNDTKPITRDNEAVTATNIRPWWMVDFQSSRAIDHVTVFRATNVQNFGARNSSWAVGNYRIFVSNDPFPNDAPTTNLTRFDPTPFPNGWSTPTTGDMAGKAVWASAPRIFPGTGPDNIPIGVKGRYLRIQRLLLKGDSITTKRYLALVEVQATSGSQPTITLTGPSTINIPVRGTYTELGATAFDQIDGDVPPNGTITVTGATFDTSPPLGGVHIVNYDFTNTNGVAADEVFRVVNVIPPPLVTLTANSTSITWTTNHNSISNKLLCTASQGWSGIKTPVGGNTPVAPTVSTAYTLTCSNPLGQIASQTVYVTVAGKPAVTIGANGSDGFTIIPLGTSASIAWNATGPAGTACTASGDWSGPLALSGSQPSGTLTTNKSYIVTCTSGSDSATAKVVVDVALTVGSCTVTTAGGSTSVGPGQPATFQVPTPLGADGTKPYLYTWSGSEISTPSNVGNPFSQSYVDTGLKYAAVTVTSGDQSVPDILCPIVTRTP